MLVGIVLTEMVIFGRVELSLVSNMTDPLFVMMAVILSGSSGSSTMVLLKTNPMKTTMMMKLTRENMVVWELERGSCCSIR